MKTSAGSATSAAPLSSTLRHGFDDNPIFYNTGQLAPCPLICNHACGGDLQRRGCRHDLRLASHQSQSVHREEWIVRWAFVQIWPSSLFLYGPSKFLDEEREVIVVYLFWLSIPSDSTTFCWFIICGEWITNIPMRLAQKIPPMNYTNIPPKKFLPKNN